MDKMDLKTMFLIALAIVCAAMVLLSPVACTVNRQKITAQAIKDGADPIAVKCAIEADTSHSPMCVAQALKPR